MTLRKKCGLIVLMALMIALIASACAGETSAQAAEPDTAAGQALQVALRQTSNVAAAQPVLQAFQQQNGPGPGQNNCPVSPLCTSPLIHDTGTPLTEAEEAGLIYMREEEKLAGDVYLYLYDLWGLPVFQNIANSEASHAAAVKNLLAVYGLTDPVGTNGPGVFTDPGLQDLYNQLIAQGSQSIVEALRVGAAIEEIDIIDLQDQIAGTERADLIQVYQNLLNGSENHLRAFVSNLARQGVTYEPQYLDLTTYQVIIEAATGAGQGYGVAGLGTGSAGSGSGGNGKSAGKGGGFGKGGAAGAGGQA